MEDVSQGAEPVKIPIVLDGTRSEACKALDQQLEQTYTYVSKLQFPAGLSNSVHDNDEESGCECEPGTCGLPSSECDCVDEHGCFYDHEGRMQLEALPPRFAIYECGPSCNCGMTCRNSVVQKGISQACEVRWTKGKGFGLFAGQDIKKGTFLCLYAGEIISTAVARERWREQKKQKQGNYILVMREHLSSWNGIAQTLVTTVDPTRNGNIGRFLNHSCPPLANLIMLPIRAQGTLVPMPALFAVKGIEAGSEMSWDYQDAGGESWFYGRESPNLELAEAADRLPCLCGSPQCRGWIPYDPTL